MLLRLAGAQDPSGGVRSTPGPAIPSRSGVHPIRPSTPSARADARSSSRRGVVSGRRSTPPWLRRTGRSGASSLRRSRQGRGGPSMASGSSRDSRNVCSRSSARGSAGPTCFQMRAFYLAYTDEVRELPRPVAQKVGGPYSSFLVHCSLLLTPLPGRQDVRRRGRRDPRILPEVLSVERQEVGQAVDGHRRDEPRIVAVLAHHRR